MLTQVRIGRRAFAKGAAGAEPAEVDVEALLRAADAA